MTTTLVPVNRPKIIVMQPNKDQLRLWADALDSGEFEQGRFVLHSTVANTYCCLGVACRVAIQNGLMISESRTPETGLVMFDGHSGMLPESVRDWYGIAGDPLIGRNQKATIANDVLRLKFPVIAAKIRDFYKL